MDMEDAPAEAAPATTDRKGRRRLPVWVWATGIAIVAISAVAVDAVTSTDPDPHRQAAEQVADAMIAEFDPPDGARPVDEAPQIHRDEADPGPFEHEIVRVTRWKVPGTAMHHAREIASAPPPGFEAVGDEPMKLGNGNLSVWFVPVDQKSSTAPEKRTDGVRQRSYEVILADVDDRTAAIWVQVSVQWAPTRSATSMIPDDVTVLVITHTPEDQAPGSVSEPTRTVRDPEDIARIADLLDGLDEGPDSDAAISCAPHPDTAFGHYELVFATADDDEVATADVDTTGCRIVNITVNGHDQGGFWGTDDLATALHDLGGSQ